MASICEQCKVNAIDIEEQVCKACGFVPEGIQFGSEFNGHSSHSSYRSHLWRKKQPPSGLSFGMDILNSLGKEFNIPSDIKAEILEVFKKVYAKRIFRRRQDIGVMAGCCLIYVQKKYQQYVPLTDVCSKLECSRKKVFKYAKLLKLNCNDFNQNGFGEPENANNLKEPTSGSDFDLFKKLESSIRVKLSSVTEDRKTSLIKKTTALIKLAYSCWIVSGRSIEGTISAASYLCWKSMHPSRRAFPFKKFCSDFSLPYNNSKCRVSELLGMLVKLGNKIPSMTKNYVNSKNVLFHLDYILENSETLRNDLLPNEFTMDEINQKEFSIFRRSYITNNRNMIDDDETTKYDSDMNASDIEISDTEINSYIRSEEQVAMIKILRKQKC